MNNNRILLVDDESNVLSALKRSLFDESLEIVTCTSAEEALKIMTEQTFKIVISDQRMTGMQGAEFLAHVKADYPQTIRMMLTGHATLEATMKAVNKGEIYRFFTKPWNDHDLIFSIRAALEKFDLEAQNRLLLDTVKQQYEEIKALETNYPGITAVAKDVKGTFVLPDISDDEITRLIADCEKEEETK